MSLIALALLAAYTPGVAIELSDAAPGAVPAVTSRMTFDPDQNATYAISARFPPAFTYNPDFDVPGCEPADEAAERCPAESRIGEVEAVSPFGSAAGPVHLMSDLRLVAHLRSYGGLVSFRSEGTITALDDGTAELRFTGLPDVPATSGRVALEGGSRGILVNPLHCGTYEVAVRFEAHGGETADVTAPVPIRGCQRKLRVRSVRLEGRRLTWRLSEPAVSTVLLLARRDGAWRERRRWRTSATQVRVGRLPAGRYRFVVRAQASDGRGSAATSLSLRRP
jgi:hypothetical protein